MQNSRDTIRTQTHTVDKQLGNLVKLVETKWCIISPNHHILEQQSDETLQRKVHAVKDWAPCAPWGNKRQMVVVRGIYPLKQGNTEGKHLTGPEGYIQTLTTFPCQQALTDGFLRTLHRGGDWWLAGIVWTGTRWGRPTGGWALGASRAGDQWEIDPG